MVYRYLLTNVRLRNLPRALVRDLIIRALTLSRLPKLLRIKPSVKKGWEGSPPIKTSLKFNRGYEIPSLVLFAHWEVTNILSDPDIHTISLLRQSGFQVIVVTTALSTTQEHDDFWDTYVDVIDGLISRENIGFDFGSWQTGLAFLGQNHITFGELILINNSLYSITENISPILEKFRNKIDAGGLIWSNEFRKHLQSFYLYFSRRAISAPEFSQFWSHLTMLNAPNTGKRKVIAKLELTWGNHFASNGTLIVDAAFKAPTKSMRNPMTFYWRDLIADDFPFLKKSLFLQNYENVDTSNFIALVGDRISHKTRINILKDIEARNFFLR